MLKKWKRITSRIAHRNPWWAYKIDRFEIPGRLCGEYHWVQTNGSSMVVPVNSEGDLMLVKQYRYLLDRESLEFPCGSVENGASFRETAELELAQEAGFCSGSLKNVGRFCPYNGVAAEMCRVYVARRLTPVIAMADETEEFERLTLKAEMVDHLIARGTIWDGMTISAWALAKLHING